MIEQEQIDFLLKHPMFYPVAVFAGAVLVLIVLKFLLGSRSTEVTRTLEDAPRSAAGRKKKGKKQKTTLERKSSDSPKSKKESRKNEMKSFIETDKQIFEEGKSDKKKDSKSKAKSKKKKNSQVKVESALISKPEVSDHGMDTGEWQTVSTKEQREQQRREKRKLEEDDAVAVDGTVDKSNSSPLVQPVYKPPANISAIAKGIAPRFAKAAGETWQEKPVTGAVPVALPSKRPMPPATIPGATKQSSKNTTVNQGWSPGKSQWPGEVGTTTWPYSTQTTTSTSLESDLIGMPWPPSDTTSSLLSMATPGDKAGWPQGGSTWQTTVTSSSGNMAFKDWVYVQEGQNGGKSLNGSNAEWAESSIQPQKVSSIQKVDEWMLEPEGFPVHAPPPQLDPNDPWNIEVVGSEGPGDWSAPASTWDNTNEEWKAPTPVKPQPGYVDVSSDEDRITSKISSHHQTSTTAGHSVSPQTIVGAGQEFINQAAANSQGQNKKSRRRRKKKTATNETENSSPLPSPTPEMETPTPETTEKLILKKDNDSKPEKNDTASDAKDTVQETKDDWTVPKAAKKRKNKARKAD